MTEHKAKPEQWALVEKYEASCFRPCLLELRSRVEALEAAQRPNVRPELQNLPEGTRLLSYRVENYALPIEEWGKGHTAVNLPTHNTPESSDSLVERVSDVIYMNAMGGYCEQARAAILAVADWLDKQELHIAATRLRQEAQ